MPSAEHRIPVLYLAPWVDIGGSDAATIDWLRFIDRERFRPSLITTQPSLNRRLFEAAPYASELWELPQLIGGDEFPRFILSFIHTRGVRVLHIMNSRLGFELLPDVASLPSPPRVVVQLHAEEPNRSGYVRYVSTRYGNLVDAFSVTSQVLSDRLGAYDIPIRKRRLIRTGVDAEAQFSPDRVRAVDGLDADRFQILFPARLTAQKNPLLMVDVAAQLRDLGLRFRIHVLGDGDLTEAVRERIVARGLEREVLLHGAQVEVAPWYAGCAAVLLTSAFEGLPVVLYEAMAMGLPTVSPDLPGLDELVTPGTGVLVRPSDQAEAYASAICTLAGDQAARRAIGEAARARVRSGFTLERMASEHATLYEQLLADAPREARAHGPEPSSRPAPVAAAFRSRRPGTQPLVSVIVTCFNQGRYLPGCLRSVARQNYRPIETIVVDDGSTEAETVAALASVEAERTATVIRMPANRGPSAARNAGIEHARGRYLLPLDSDDLLVEGAVAELVEQLGQAGEQVGFIYPNLQFFGNRNDYLEMPSFNLHALLAANHCAVSSLIDREVFDRGFRYPEEITLGHEDWDFVLTLAEHGIYGAPARTKTLLCRKHGFTRGDLVESSVPFGEVAAARHPGLFARRSRLKGEWNPALTLVALDPISVSGDALQRLVSGAARQTCLDFEVVIRSGREPWPSELGRRLRRIPTELSASRAGALALGLQISRGRSVLAVYGSPEGLLSDPALVEKTLQILRGNPRIAALALADSRSDQLPFLQLDASGVRGAVLGALCWSTTGSTAPPASLALPGHRPLEALASWLGVHAAVQWRQHPASEAGVPRAAAEGPPATLGAPRHLRPSDADHRRAPADLPACPPGVPYRLGSAGPWRPPQTRLLCRHRHHASGRYIYTNGTEPDGCVLEHVLGCVGAYPFPGTTSLLVREDQQEFAFGEPAELRDPGLLGFLEEKPLPLFDSLLCGRHPDTGAWVLAAAEDDSLAVGLEDTSVVGYLQPYPSRPRLPPHTDIGYGLAGLVRTVDLQVRRHRYGAGHVPAGVAAGELGALFAEPVGECDPLWIDDQGRVFAGAGAWPEGRPSLRTALRWTADPLTWRGFSWLGPKLRATARRAYDSAGVLAAPPVTPGRPGQPAGYLLRAPTERTVPLYAASHPVTGDQLLSTDPHESSRLGYRDQRLLGHLLARAPVTGALGPTRPGAPWAARFGLEGVG